MTVDPNAPLTEVPGAPVVRAEPDSRLEQLTAVYDRLDTQSKDIETKLKETKDEIKLELQRLHPTQTEVLLVSGSCSTPLRMYLQTKWVLAGAEMKKRDPATWVRWARETHSWYLARVK
jgi:hypothetical protein